MKMQNIDRSVIKSIIKEILKEDLSLFKEVIKELLTENQTIIDEDQESRRAKLEELINADFTKYDDVFKALAK